MAGLSGYIDALLNNGYCCKELYIHFVVSYDFLDLWAWFGLKLSLIEEFE